MTAVKDIWAKTQRKGGWSHAETWGKRIPSRRRSGLRKGPEAGWCSVCLRNNEEAVATAEWVRKRVRGDEDREETGQSIGGLAGHGEDLGFFSE